MNTKDAILWGLVRQSYNGIGSLVILQVDQWNSVEYNTGDQGRNNSRKNEGVEPKQKQYPVVDVTGDRGKGEHS